MQIKTCTLLIGNENLFFDGVGGMLKSAVSWDVVLCNPAEVHCRFGTYYLDVNS
jgi:hypothetical protein